jgi:hypothetical protein
MVTEVCGCGVRFAVGLMRCPRCRALAPRFSGIVKEDAVPRITVSGGASNPDARPGEVGYVEPVGAQAEGAPPQVVAPVEEDAGAPPVEVRGESGPELAELPEGSTVSDSQAAPDYGSMTQAALRELAKARGLPVGGSKADLAARLAGNDVLAVDA